jgi:hypothetical protein
MLWREVDIEPCRSYMGHNRPPGRRFPQVLGTMPLTRPPARSSFTFEIKRANRRTPEVVTRSKTSSQCASLANEVFGAASTRAFVQASAPVAPPSPVAPDQNEDPRENDASAGPPPRRVLPDLLSAAMDPVTERMRHEAEERKARRIVAQADRRHASAKPREAARREERTASRITPPDVAPKVQTETPPSVETVPTPTTKDQRKGLRHAALRAQRAGQPLPRLPAGQRWKRRLPIACW